MTAKRPRSFAHLVYFALTALVLSLYGVAGVPLRQARSLWREGKVHEAEALLEQWARLRLRPAGYAEALAVVKFTAGDRQGGERLLASRSRFGRTLSSPFDEREVAERFLRLGRYRELLSYAAAIDHENRLSFYTAAALVGVGKVKEGEAVLAGAERSGVAPRAVAALEQMIAERRDGTYAVLLDRDGRAIASYSTRQRRVVAVPEFSRVIELASGAYSVEAQRRLSPEQLIETSLDSNVQRAALEAIGDFRGSFVAIDVERSEIVAIANTHDSGENVALGGKYEPGSVMKVLTLAAAIESGVDVKSLFPFHCRGVLEIDGRRFHDWAQHGRMDSVDEALATSCNLVFGKLGLMVGARRLEELWRRAGFDTDADLGILRAPLGRQTAPLAPDFALATAACGLELETTNALHLAMIAAAIANGGSFVEPRLVTGRRTITGERVHERRKGKATRFASPATVAAIQKAMRAVVTDPRGTGRRAAIDGIAIAMKTGTAGERDPTYDSVAIAFAPAEKPRLAIGLIAENGGPAELAAARIVRSFFEATLAAAPVQAATSDR